MSMTESGWADLVLTDLGIAPNAPDEVDLENWMANEEPPAEWWGGFGTADNPTRLNPLNASVGSGSGGGISPGGLGSYPDLTTAAAYTAGMIKQSNMSSIYGALEAEDPPDAFGQAVIDSPWAQSHYGYDPSRFTGTTTLGPAVTSPTAIGSGQGGPGATLTAYIPGTHVHIPGTGSGSSILPNVGGSIKSAGAYIALILSGATMVVLGVWKLANPGSSVTDIPGKVRQSATQAASVAATAAA